MNHKRSGKPVEVVHNPQRIGLQYPHAIAPCSGHHLVLKCPSLSVGISKSLGYDNNGFDSSSYAFFNTFEHQVPGLSDNGKI
jgi:hypothetical protein